MNTNETKLRETIATLFGLAPGVINDRTSQHEIASWDSLGMINLVNELELVFGVQFSVLDIADFKNVGLIKTVLREKGVLI